MDFLSTIRAIWKGHHSRATQEQRNRDQGMKWCHNWAAGLPIDKRLRVLGAQPAATSQISSAFDDDEKEKLLRRQVRFQPERAQAKLLLMIQQLFFQTKK